MESILGLGAEAASCNGDGDQAVKQEPILDVDLLYPEAQPLALDSELNAAISAALKLPLQDFEQPAVPAKKRKRCVKIRPIARMCILCHKVYVSHIYLQRHLAAKHRVCEPVHQIECEFCSAKFSDLESFYRHDAVTKKNIREQLGPIAKTVEEQQEYARALQHFARTQEKTPAAARAGGASAEATAEQQPNSEANVAAAADGNFIEMVPIAEAEDSETESESEANSSSAGDSGFEEEEMKQ